MELNQVPQDEKKFRDGGKLKKLVYATDNNGNYTGVQSAGWEAENLAMQQAWEEIDRNLAATMQRVYAAEVSPLAFFMQKHLMDVALLASYAGKWQWQVKRHMKPDVFKKLDTKVLAGYAAIFNITIEELKNFGKTPPNEY
jgi:hypothetical protein